MSPHPGGRACTPGRGSRRLLGRRGASGSLRSRTTTRSWCCWSTSRYSYKEVADILVRSAPSCRGCTAGGACSTLATSYGIRYNYLRHRPQRVRSRTSGSTVIRDGERWWRATRSTDLATRCAVHDAPVLRGVLLASDDARRECAATGCRAATPAFRRLAGGARGPRLDEAHVQTSFRPLPHP